MPDIVPHSPMHNKKGVRSYRRTPFYRPQITDYRSPHLRHNIPVYRLGNGFHITH
jgi:hypothetical protein